jgi:hypothetical protein
MTYERFVKAVVSLVFVAALIVSSGFAGISVSNSVALAQGRGRSWQRHWDRDRDHWVRIRRLDRDRQLRYRTNGSFRQVGYFDRFGRFHAYGYYDRFGRFHRY